MSNNVDNWNPTNEHDVALKEALLTLQKSTGSVLLSPGEGGDDEEKKFLLQGHSYFALKAYVLTGKEFPVNDSEFDAKFPQKAFTKIEPMKAGIQADTKKSLVAVGSSCSSFYKNKLQNIVDIGSLAVTWSTSTLGLLTEDKDTNLHGLLKVLSDPKYKKLEDRDEAFHDALTKALFALELLKNQAEDGKTQAKALRTDLDQFRDATALLQPGMTKLIETYTGGQNPLISVLNSEHARKVKEQTEKLTKSNVAESDWKDATGKAVAVGVSLGWFPLIGWAPLIILSIKASDLKKVYDNLWTAYNNLKQENEDEAFLIDSINKMGQQFVGLEAMIQDAITAIGVLSIMFEDQSRSYELIRTSLTRLRDIAGQEDFLIRSSFIVTQINTTRSSLLDLNKAAGGFVKAILTETDMKTLG